MKTLRCLSCGYDRTGNVMQDGVTATEPCETCGSVAVNVTVTDHKTAKPKTVKPKTVEPKAPEPPEV